MALLPAAQALDYAESRNYTEPLFVFVVMVMAASRPILGRSSRAVDALARLRRCRRRGERLARAWPRFRCSVR